MKIAFLNDMIYDYAFQSEQATWATGGAERQQWLLARAMASAGWTVTVGVRRPRSRQEKRRDIDGVKFIGNRPGADFPRVVPLFPVGTTRLVVLAVRQPSVRFWCGARASCRRQGDLRRRASIATFGCAKLSTAARDGGPLRVRPVSGRSHRAAARRSTVRSARTLEPQGVRRSQYRLRAAHASCRTAERSPTVAWIAALRRHKRPDRLIEIARLLPHVRFVVCGSPSTYMTPAGYSERAIEAFRTLPNIDYRGQVSPEDALRIAASRRSCCPPRMRKDFRRRFSKRGRTARRS